MAVTVTLSDDVSERLLTYAGKLRLPLDALVDELIGNALHVAETGELEPKKLTTNGIHAHNEDDTLPSFDKVLARIKALPPNPNAIEPATKTVEELIADLGAEPPSDELLTFEEMWPLWQKFEQELKTMDEANALRDTLG